MLAANPVRAAALLAVAAALAAPAAAQSPSPTPTPPQLLQDELDLLARSNVVQGSGARAFGMAGAFLARADDATAASWNPAGLSYLRQPELSLVWTDTSLKSIIRNAAGALLVDDQRSGHAPDFMAFTYPFDLGSASGAAQFSFQRVISFTGDRTIEEASRTRRVSSEGGFDVLALGSGLRVSRQLRLGFVINHWLNGYRQTIEKADRVIPSRQNQDFSLSGWNVHFGLMWSPFESLNLGATIKSGFTSGVTLKRSRVDTFPPELGGETTNAYRRDDLELDLPGAVGLGASWRPRSNLTLSLDYTRSYWSNGEIRNFFTLQRALPSSVVPPPPPPPPTETGDFYLRLPYPTLTDDHQQDTKQVRAGVEYVVLKNRLKWPLRAGYFSDRQYFRAEGGKAPTFDGLSAGTGLIIGRFLLDVAYVREHGSYTDLEGRRNSVQSNRAYASLIYRHPRKP
jgi:long-subunit fatty acid transport protein